MAELNFNANIPFPPAAPTTQTPPHIVPGSPIDQFLSRTQQNLTAQADSEQVTTSTNNHFEMLPRPVTTFWPEDYSVVTAAEVVVNEPEAARFPVEPVINPQFEAESQTQIKPMPRLSMPWEAGPQFETPVEPAAGAKSSGRKKNPVKAAAKEHVKSLYNAYMELCAQRKVAMQQWDDRIRDAYNRFMDAKKVL